jgi:hypothetical protein
MGDEMEEAIGNNDFSYNLYTCRYPNNSVDSDRFFFVDAIKKLSIIYLIYMIIDVIYRI